MFDMHYDLLSRLYYDYIKYGSITSDTKNDINKIYNENNVIGGCINLYFLNEEEMINEIGLTKEELSDVPSIFKKCIELINELKQEGIINSNIKFIYSIEGCDYIKDEYVLDELYKIGLRSILLVWNNKNKYGSGNRSDIGLTDLGKKFIKHAIELGMIIDVSHANINTFYGILDIVKEEKLKGNSPILIASHSNSKEICDVSRNLSYQQLVDLKNLDGYIGIVSYNPFVGNASFKEIYLKHINYMIEIIGFSTDKILLSTDNMDFINNMDNTFNIYNMNNELRTLLSKKYSNDDINKILYENAFKILSKLKN